MASAVNPRFISEIERLGAFDIQACYSCGNCTAICPLSDEAHSFPRRMIRYSVLGLEEKALGSPDLWLCYYCGQCTDTCPREADPGSLMMALRRYATRRYSLGRVADIFYSGFASTIAWTVLTLAAIVGMVTIFREPHPNLQKVDLFSFINLGYLHIAGLIMAAVIFFFALVQLGIMARSVTRGKQLKGKWIGSFFRVLFNEVFIQRKFNQCEEKQRYIAHLCLLWGFLGLLLVTLLLFAVDLAHLPDFVRIIARVIGVPAGLALLYGSGFYIWRRRAIKDAYSKYTHHSDWVFAVSLFLVGLTGFLTVLFHVAHLPWPTYIMFIIHLVVAFDLLLAAPFTKFAHAIYRPLAIWLSEVWG